MNKADSCARNGWTTKSTLTSICEIFGDAPISRKNGLNVFGLMTNKS